MKPSDAPKTRGDFYALPLLSAQLPLVHDDDSRFFEMTGDCNGCDVTVPDDCLRGHVTRPFRKVFVIEAWGYCEKCNLVTPFVYRFLPGMTITGRTKEGEWGTWRPQPSWWGRIRKFLRSCMFVA